MDQREKNILSDEFLNELAKEINELYGGTDNEQDAEIVNNDEKLSPL